MNNYVYIVLLFVKYCDSTVHNLPIMNDQRSYIPLTSFGFYQYGYLNLTLKSFRFRAENDAVFGFTLEKVKNDAIDPHMETYSQICLLEKNNERDAINNKEDIVFFKFNFKENKLEVNCSTESSVSKLLIFKDTQFLSSPITRDSLIDDPNPIIVKFASKSFACSNISIPLVQKKDGYSLQFAVFIPTRSEEGLYELFFHSCANYQVDSKVLYSFNVHVEERNVENYLSAGEIPLPTFYFIMSIIFFSAASFWIHILTNSRHPVFKIHYLMAALIILKSVALLFHGMNLHFIEIRGEHVATWAVLFYVTHLLKGSVLFITIILIGSGWTFIKHILSPRDKRIFMIVIPLQVFANVAEIIIDESEKGDIEYRMWINVFTFVDLLCCIIIAFPIIWSIKHLHDASQTDGKAVVNLRKLKLFRHFYIMIACYIYFTRIIVYLLKISVPFQYTWLNEMFRETATFIFYILTGYKFRPASENPYFHVPEDDDNEMEVVFSQCGLTEGLTKLNRMSNEVREEGKEPLLVSKHENIHDYD